MLRGGTEHDHVVGALRFDDIGDDHRDVVDPTLLESLADEALSGITTSGRLQGGLDHVVVDQPAYAVAAEHQRSPATTGTIGEVGSLVGCPFSTFSSSERWGASRLRFH